MHALRLALGCFGLAVLAACGAPAVQTVPGGGVPVSVTSATGVPYTYADGAQAKAQADAQCGTGGVRTSIRDRFDAATGAWVFPEGCA
jgi:hypothetical protein